MVGRWIFEIQLRQVSKVRGRKKDAPTAPTVDLTVLHVMLQMSRNFTHVAPEVVFLHGREFFSPKGRAYTPPEVQQETPPEPLRKTQWQRIVLKTPFIRVFVKLRGVYMMFFCVKTKLVKLTFLHTLRLKTVLGKWHHLWIAATCSPKKYFRRLRDVYDRVWIQSIEFGVIVFFLLLHLRFGPRLLPQNIVMFGLEITLSMKLNR